MSVADLQSYRLPGIFQAAHQQHHNLVADKTGTPRVVVDPINFDDVQAVKVFLLDHYLAHQEVNKHFNTTGPDLSEVDFSNQEAIDAWVDLNWIDHNSWDGSLNP